jgi:hypothetical protein
MYVKNVKGGIRVSFEDPKKVCMNPVREGLA